jgi:diguanylate cyclase (GGDEF)-like protein
LTDPLTGLKNRRAFLSHLNDEVDRSRRDRSSLSLVMLDIDDFKSYNDTFGHPAGDAVLERVGTVLSEESRTTDMVARYGGEEFVITLVGTDSTGAGLLAERFRQEIEQAGWAERPITASIGVACTSGAAADATALIKAADEALYRAKSAGRNCVV